MKLQEIQSRHDFKLSKSKQQLSKTTKQCESIFEDLQRSKQYIDTLKVQHKSTIAQMKQLHAATIESKNKQLKEADELVEGLEEMFQEMVAEVNDATNSANTSSQRLERAKAKASQAHSKLMEHKILTGELKDELRDGELATKDLTNELEECREAIDYLYDERERMQTDFNSIIEYLDEYASPKPIAKHYVPNRNGRGVHAEWLPHVDKLIIEMLANRTPPTCIQANIYAMAKVIYPHDDIVKELPSLKYIKDLRIPLYTVTKTLAAHRLGNAVDWKQIHSDETSRRQVSLLNVVQGVIEKDYDKIRTICLDLAILPKNSTAEEQSIAIIGVYDELAKLLTDWRTETSRLFPHRQDLLEHIADPTTIDVTRLLGNMVEHDSCSTARKTGDLVCDKIIELCRQKGITDPTKLIMYQGDCLHHIRCVLFNAIDNFLGAKLEEHLSHSLKLVPKNVRVSCRLGDVNIQCDKEFNETANYAKGHGDMFGRHLARNHPDKPRLTCVRVMGGTRQDASFEGAVPIFDMVDEMLEFTHEHLLTGENQLQRLLYIILSSMEYIAQLQVASIFYSCL